MMRKSNPLKFGELSQNVEQSKGEGEQTTQSKPLPEMSNSRDEKDKAKELSSIEFKEKQQSKSKQRMRKVKPINQKNNFTSIKESSIDKFPFQAEKTTFKRRKTFEEQHKRMTTYIQHEHVEKLKELKTTYGTPISKTLNKALEEYFSKHKV